MINLRGKVIPVVDLRLKFGLEARDYDARTCIIVVGVGAARGAVMTGIIVDCVSEVLNLAGEDIEDTPDFGTNAETQYLLGMAKVKGNLKILLDIDAALASADLAGLREVIG